LSKASLIGKPPLFCCRIYLTPIRIFPHRDFHQNDNSNSRPLQKYKHVLRRATMTLLNVALPWSNATMTSNATLAPLNPSTAPSNSTIAPTHAAAALSHTQDVIIESIERVGAGISVPCVVFLIWTFLAYQRLRTPSNTLLFNASPANLFAGIASLIGRAGLSRPNAATCQIQGLFLEW
jgi:hypothetical protein